MADEWTEDENAAPKKGIPFWVWGCGGGCLLAAILAIVLVVFAVDKVKDAMDPDVVWPQIDKILAFDERPSGYQAYGTTIGGGGGYGIICESKKLLGVLILGGAEDDEEMDNFFSGEFEGGGFMGFGGIKNTEPMNVTIKGEEYRAVRFDAAEVGGPAAAGRKGSGPASILLIDLSAESGPVVIIELFDLSGETGQDDVDSFFEPFTPRR